MRSENMAKTPVMPIAKTSVPERKSESLNLKEFAAVCMLVSAAFKLQCIALKLFSVILKWQICSLGRQIHNGTYL